MNIEPDVLRDQIISDSESLSTPDQSFTIIQSPETFYIDDVDAATIERFPTIERHAMDTEERYDLYTRKRSLDTDIESSSKRQALEVERLTIGKRKDELFSPPIIKKQAFEDEGLIRARKKESLFLPRPGDEIQPKTWIQTKYFGPGNNIAEDVRDVPVYPPESFALRHDKDIAYAQKLSTERARLNAIMEANTMFFRRMDNWYKNLKHPSMTDQMYYRAFTIARGTHAMDFYTTQFSKTFRKSLRVKNKK